MGLRRTKGRGPQWKWEPELGMLQKWETELAVLVQRTTAEVPVGGGIVRGRGRVLRLGHWRLKEVRPKLQTQLVPES